MLDSPEIVTTQSQPTAVIRLTIPRAEIGKVMGPAIGEVMSTVAAQGIAPAGPLFSYHPRIDPELFDFEVGVPVAAPVAPAGRVEHGELPAARVARTIYRGPYEGLGTAWGELDAWMRQNGHLPAPGIWECYLAGPESGDDPAQWQTQLNHPVAG
jgi:effector-binding domain-containing protein